MCIGKIFSIALAAVIGIAVLAHDARAGIALGQIDRFDNGTTESWQFGHGLPILMGGGQAGPTDDFIKMTSGVGGLAPNLIIFNDAQWIGDYFDAGVTQIDMDLIDESSTPLTMRIAVKTGKGGTPGWVSNPFALPADGAWHHASFLLDAADMFPVDAPPDLPTLLTNVGDFRILDSVDPKFTGDGITAAFGVDNIQALPEPAGAFVALGAMSLKLCGRRRFQ